MSAERALTSDADAASQAAASSADPTPVTDRLLQSSGSYELVLSAVVLGLLGLYLDSRTGTTPLLAVTFSVLGFIGAGLSAYYRFRHRIARLQAETASLRSLADDGKRR